MTTYKIVRFYSPEAQARGKRSHAVRGKRGLTLEEAQAHCKDPKTRKEGEYFDGYTAEQPSKRGES